MCVYVHVCVCIHAHAFIDALVHAGVNVKARADSIKVKHFSGFHTHKNEFSFRKGFSLAPTHLVQLL